MTGQSLILICTLAAMLGLWVGYGIGWVLDPRQMPMVMLGTLMALWRGQVEASALVVAALWAAERRPE